MIRFDDPPPSAARQTHRALTRAVVRHRRAGAALLAAVAVWTGVAAVADLVSPATVEVVVAIRDLPAGHRVSDDDVRTVLWPADLAPPGRIDAGRAVTAGAVTVAPVGRDEALTDTRVSVATGAAAPLDDATRVVVPLADPLTARIVGVGSTVDIHLPASAAWDVGPVVPDDTVGRAGDGTGSGPLARDAHVVEVLSASDGAGVLGGVDASPGGTALVVAVRPGEAVALASFAGHGLAVTVPPQARR